MSDAARISFAAIDRENPWPGLASFTEDSREFFFGREKETEELSRLVRRQTLTVLFGQSGLGKSSLLHAGLFPLLRETDHLPLYLRLDHAPSTPAPAEQVKSALTAAFAAAKADAPAFRADETLWEYFHRKDVDIWSAKNRLLTPVLAFDQFEEVFTLGRADEASRERSRVFLAELACLVENRAPAAVQERMDRGELDPARFNFTKPSCQVILSLREDFLPDLESLKQSMPALVHNRLRLKKLSGTQALEIVTKPAPHLLAEGVAEKIVEFVAGARGGSAERLAELDVEPPLLSVICRELNDRRRALGQEKITADLVSGNRREILTDFYERSVADLPAPMRTFVEDHLLTKSGFRDNLALETALEFPGVARPLIDTLVSRRLLRVEDRLGVQRVELTHDVLAEVIRAARDARQQRLALEEAREKERHALAAAARAARRQRWVIAGLGAAVVLLLVGAFFGIRAQRRSAAQASQTDLVLGSRLLDEGKVAEGLAYLVRAGYKDRSNRLVGPRLLSALSGNSFMLPTAEPLRLPSPAVNAGFLSDGRRLLFRGADRILRQIDVESWQVAPNFSVPDETGRVVRTAEKNADVFAMAGDGQIFICDGATGQSRIPPIDVPGQISGGGRRRSLNMVLSPDGHWVAAAGPGEMWIWDATSGALIATLPSNSEFTPFAFSPDSRGLAIGRDRVVSIWSIVDRAFASASVPSAADIYFIGFSGDGRRLFAVNYDGTLVADAGSGTLVRPLIPFISNNATFATVQLSRDGNLLLYATSSRTVTVIDVATGRPAYAPLQLSSNLERFDQVAEGKTLFAVSLDGTARLWDLATGNLLSESTLHRPRQPPAVVSPDGRTIVLFTATGEAYRLRPGGPPAAPLALPRERATTHFINMIPELPARLSWVTPTARLAIDIATGRETVGTINFPEPITDAGRGGYGFTFGPGDTFAVRTGTGELRFWTLGEKEVARNVPLADPPSGNIILQGWAIDSDVHRLAYRLGASNKLGIWDSQTGRRIVVIEPEEPVSQSRFGTSVAFSPDGKYVAVRTGGRLLQNVIVFEVSTGKSQFVLRGSENAGLATCRYSPDGRRILTGDNWGGIQVWNAATGALIRSTQHHRSTVVKFEFSPDRHFYASVSNEGSVQVWDAVTDQPVGELLEQSGGATRAEFSPDSTRIATPSASSQARIWDVQTGLPVTGPLSNEGDPTTITVFSLDGKFVDVHGGATNVKQLVRVWAVPPSGVGHTPDWLLTFATICAGQRLTDQGKFVSAIDELEKIDAVQRTLAAAPADDAFAEWGRWLLSTDANRPIAPGFAITPAEAAKVRDNFLASLTAAPATKP